MNINKENMQEKAGTTRYPSKVPRMEFVQTRDGRKEHGKFADNPIIFVLFNSEVKENLPLIALVSLGRNKISIKSYFIN